MEEAILIPEECSKCKNLFDLKYDLKVFEIEDDEFVSEKIKNRFGSGYLCWKCRESRVWKCVLNRSN